jgi:hypothetical protein
MRKEVSMISPGLYILTNHHNGERAGKIGPVVWVDNDWYFIWSKSGSRMTAPSEDGMRRLTDSEIQEYEKAEKEYNSAKNRLKQLIDKLLEKDQK